MASIKRGAFVASTLMLIAVMISACNQPYSQQPSVTNTPINPGSLFPSPIGTTPGMDNVEAFGTGTALAALATQTPLAAIDATLQNLAGTATPVVSVNTATSTLAVGAAVPTSGAPTSGALPTSAPVGTRPTEYTLKRGEFPYCIARRFDVDPEALLSLNGLPSGTIYYAERTLRIPQSGSFPGTRALRNHPATYTVASSSETVHSIACLFGDVNPSSIATANNITETTALTTGQQLNIP